MATSSANSSSKNRTCFVRLLSEQALLPVRATMGAAGVDLFSPTDGVIEKGKRQLIPLDIQLFLPLDTFGIIKARSGLALNNGIGVLAGIIDYDFEGKFNILVII